MNWNISRNLEQRKALMRKIEDMKKDREAEIAAIPENMSDEDYDSAFDAIWAKYDTLPISTKIIALEYPQTRDGWFKGFVESFGECSNRRITRKQADVFIRHSEPRHEWKSGRGMQYYVRVGDLFIRTEVFSQSEPGYVTIEKLI